jgi:hypothetical protein
MSSENAEEPENQAWLSLEATHANDDLAEPQEEAPSAM